MQKKTITTGLAIVVCFALALGIVYGLSQVSSVSPMPSTANSSTYSEQSGDEWPLYRGGFYHNGTTTTTAASNDGPFWNYTCEVSVFSGVAVTGGYVYAPTANTFYCFNANTGALVWKSFEHQAFIESAPAVAGYGLYFGTYGSKNMICSIDTVTGASLWNYTTAGEVHSSPVVSGGYVYCGDNIGGLSQLSAISGGLVNSYNTYGGVRGAPTVVNGKVYASMGNYIVCLNAADLSFVWATRAAPTSFNLLSTPTVYGSNVYVSAGSMLCLATSNGAVVWNRTDISPSGYGSPAAVGGYGYVYIGSENSGSGIYCLNALTGATVWNTPMTGYQWSTPSINLASGNPDKLYVGSSNGVLYCLNPLTGAQVWNYTTGGRITSSPAIVNGRVYFGSEDMKVYCMPMTLTSPTTTGTTPPPGIPAYPFWAIGIAGIFAICVILRKKGFLAINN